MKIRLMVQIQNPYPYLYHYQKLHTKVHPIKMMLVTYLSSLSNQKDESPKRVLFSFFTFFYRNMKLKPSYKINHKQSN